MKWISSLPTFVWIGLAAVLAIGAIVWLSSRDKHNQEIGAAVQREENLREVLKRTETGNEVRERVIREPSAAYDECLRSARTPANCVGLLPDGADHNDGATAERGR